VRRLQVWRVGASVVWYTYTILNLASFPGCSNIDCLQYANTEVDGLEIW